MKNRLAIICAGLLTVLLLAALVTFNHQKPRMLVLHGFSEEGPWEQAFNRGFEQELSRHLEPLSVRWRYMMFSQYLSPRQWRAASLRSREFIDSWRPDVLVTVGEEAQAFVGRHYAGHETPKIVYSMGEDPELFGYRMAANVTGVHESLPLDQMLDIFKFYNHSGPLRIRALGVDDLTGQAEAQQVQAQDWGAHQLLGVELVKDYVAWQDRVQAMAGQVDVLLVLSTGGLPRAQDQPEDVDPLELSAWTEQHVDFLAIGIRESYVRGGGVLSVVPSPVGLGGRTARHALQVLGRMRTGQALPPAEQSRDFLIAIRPDLARGRGLELPAIYLQSARNSQTLYSQPKADPSVAPLH